MIKETQTFFPTKDYKAAIEQYESDNNKNSCKIGFMDFIISDKNIVNADTIDLILMNKIFINDKQYYFYLTDDKNCIF